jgi:hypothetical protein
MASVSPVVAHQPRFGWSASADDVKIIQGAVKTAEWQHAVVEDKLCFSQTESGLGVVNSVKTFFSNLVDGLKLRWQMFRKGYGLFASFIPEKADVFRLYRFSTPEEATEAETRFQKTSEQLRIMKTKLLSKAVQYRQDLAAAQTAHGTVETSSLAIPYSWLNPFPTAVSIKVPGTKSTNGKQPWIQEHYISTTQVAKVDDKTLLVRVRLGPHN